MNLQGEGTEVSYQWQEDRGEGFVDLINDSQYSGIHTAIMKIEVVSLEMSGYKSQSWSK